MFKYCRYKSMKYIWNDFQWNFFHCFHYWFMMFLAVDQPQPHEPEEATSRTACTSTSVPVQQSADGNTPKRKRNRDISEIHLEVLAAEKDKLRLECDYNLKMKKSVCRTWINRDAEHFFKKWFFELLVTLSIFRSLMQFWFKNFNLFPLFIILVILIHYNYFINLFLNRWWGYSTSFSRLCLNIPNNIPFSNSLHNADSLKILESWTDPSHLATTFVMQK